MDEPTSVSRPSKPIHSQMATYALATLFLFSVAMFTLPFVAFFGVRHILTDWYPVDSSISNVWSVVAAVAVVNAIICAYAYKAYHEKEYDDDGNEIKQYSYELPSDSSKSRLNLKQD